MSNKNTKIKLKQWLLLFPSLITAGTATALLTACGNKKTETPTKSQDETCNNKPSATTTYDVHELFNAVKKDFGFVDENNNTLIKASFGNNLKNLINLKVNSHDLTSFTAATLLQSDTNEAKSAASYNFLTQVLRLAPETSQGKSNKFNKKEANEWKLEINVLPPLQELMKLTSDKISMETNNHNVVFSFNKADGTRTAWFTMPLKDYTEDVTNLIRLYLGLINIEEVLMAEDKSEKLANDTAIDKKHKFILDSTKPRISDLQIVLEKLGWIIYLEIDNVKDSNNAKKSDGKLAAGDVITFNLVIVEDKTIFKIPLDSNNNNKYTVKR